MPIASHILFPVDFSERCAAMKPMVLDVARRFGAKLTLLHAMEFPPPCYSGPEMMVPVFFDVPAIRDRAACGLDQYFSPVETAGLTVDTVVEDGDAAMAIVQTARRRDIDLIMMPTHGYGAFRGLLMGSVTAKVLHDAEGRVWTSAHDKTSDASEFRGIRNIVCAVGLDPENANLMCYAARLGRVFDARVTVAHALPATSGLEQYLDSGYRHALTEYSRDEIVKLQAVAKLDLPIVIKPGPPQDVIREAAMETDADLVVIGRGHAQDRLGRIRTHTYSIVHESPCAVLSV